MAQQLARMQYCKYCCKQVPVLEVVNERQEGHDYNGDACTFYWDFATGECGHTLYDRSH